jgi:hypothetical protein
MARVEYYTFQGEYNSSQCQCENFIMFLMEIERQKLHEFSANHTSFTQHRLEFYFMRDWCGQTGPAWLKCHPHPHLQRDQLPQNFIIINNITFSNSVMTVTGVIILKQFYLHCYITCLNY